MFCCRAPAGLGCPMVACWRSLVNPSDALVVLLPPTVFLICSPVTSLRGPACLIIPLVRVCRVDDCRLVVGTHETRFPHSLFPRRTGRQMVSSSVVSTPLEPLPLSCSFFLLADSYSRRRFQLGVRGARRDGWEAGAGSAITSVTEGEIPRFLCYCIEHVRLDAVHLPRFLFSSPSALQRDT